MRDFKFRFWDSTAKRMVYPPLAGYEQLVIRLSGCVTDGSTNADGVLMQFTGLLDKNGVEIYEGDIVNVPYNGIGDQVAKFQDGQFTIRQFKVSACCVVGNIYEK